MISIYKSYNDTELTQLLKMGDLAAFTEIHDRYYAPLYSHAYKRYPYREEVKDILQELFFNIWNSHETVEFSIGLFPYLCTAVRHRILNIYRHEKIKENYISAFQTFLDDNTEPMADETIRLKELVSLINNEVAGLPPQMRRVFQMSREGNLTHKEIAHKLNISVLTVRKQVQNSLKIIRTKLSAHLFNFFL
jgi:RNA polymerase sigma-70 factor (family 1)